LLNKKLQVKSYKRQAGFLLLAAYSLLLLSGCGFQLRGSGQATAWPAQLQQLQLSFDNSVDSDFKQIVRYMLMDRYDVKIVARDAPELVISAVQRNRRVLSLSATGKASEYLLRFRVGFVVNGLDGKALIEPQTVRLQRDFTFDNTSILAKEVEEERLSEQMQNDAVRRILHRVMVLNQKR